MRVRTGENPSQTAFDHPETVPGLTALPDDHSDEFEPSPREECGVFGVWAPGEDVSRLSYFGLYALQHRGQESAGIATSNGSQILVYKDLGLVSQVFDDQALSNLTGHMAVGHVRYATQGATTWENAQPMLGPAAGSTLALAHNGNLTNTRELMAAVRAATGEDLTGELGRGSSTDTAVIAALMNLVSERGRLATRDDSLVGDGRRTYPGVGLSIGVSRLVSRVLGRGLAAASRKVPTCVLVAVNSEEERPGAEATAMGLRRRGIPADVSPSSAKFGKQIRFADRRGIPYVWFSTEDGEQVKDIRSGEQTAADPETWSPPPLDLLPRVSEVQ